MIRVLAALACLALPAFGTQALAQGVSATSQSGARASQARRDFNSQSAQQRLGVGESGRSQPVTTAPSATGGTTPSGQYRAPSGTMTTPNR